jgi:carboxypeptidase C (cathepsin A)
MGSPKFYIGESYGGFRGPQIAHKLQSEIGIGLSGLVLLSPVLDFGLLSQPRHAPMEFVTRLPSYAAAQLERKGTVSRDALAAIERYAAGEYLVDLTRGLQDRDAVERASTRVAEITGLDPELVRRRAGRVDMGTFAREFRRQEGRIISLYDTGVSSPDPDPTSPSREGEDPGLTALTAPLTSAMVDHLWRNLGWRVPNQRYELLNGSVNGRWRYGRGRSAPQVVDDLKHGGPRAHRPRDPVFRERTAPSPASAGYGLARVAGRLSGGPHVLHPRRIPRGFPGRCGAHVRGGATGAGRGLMPALAAKLDRAGPAR